MIAALAESFEPSNYQRISKAKFRQQFIKRWERRTDADYLILENLVIADLLQRIELGIEVLTNRRYPGITEEVVHNGPPLWVKNLVSYTFLIPLLNPNQSSS